VGVDVFFVISGYLITTIILKEKDSDSFSLVPFYKRWARRILPALFLVMLFSLGLAWLWLLPSDMKRFSKSLIAVSTFVSNLFFLSEAGYWDVANGLKPLMHTCSLAVDEQYYLLFPLFLLVTWRFGRRLIFAVFVMIAAGGLALAQ
jgi:peptidoglycan/LPS O-acetylase OafA/YrhL